MRSFLGFAFMIAGIVAWVSAFGGYGNLNGSDDLVVAVIGTGLFVGGCALIGPQRQDK